ncbi:D-alanine--D-alanyl carrier protein ligase [Streptomyces spiroverticillatus]
MGVLGEGGRGHRRDVVRVDERLAALAQRQRQRSVEDGLPEDALVEVLVEPVGPYDRPVHPAGTDQLFGGDQPVVAHLLDGPAGQQDQSAYAGRDRAADEVRGQRQFMREHQIQPVGAGECGFPGGVVVPVEGDGTVAGGGTDRVVPRRRDPDPGTGPEDTAFLMYTSGSTGRPKGVRIAHRGLARLGPHSGALDITSRDGLTQSAAFSFAASTIEIWLAFLHGATLLPMPPGLPSLPVLREAVEQRGATVLSLPCGLFNALVDQEPQCLRPVRIVLLSGDFPSPDHLRRALAHTDAVIYNGYGCTENSSITALHPLSSPEDVDGGGLVPIGQPLPAVTLEVYDPELRPCDTDEVGELCVGGAGVALGYADQPELTAEKFVPDPGGEGLLYRTGDLARRNKDGDIVLVGRSDSMVKVRGFRVETSAVTLAVRALDGIADAAVKAFEDDETREKQLVAFYTTPDGRPAEAGDLVRRLSADLPSHMIPSAFRHLEKMPTNVNGKVDRTALTLEPQKNSHKSSRKKSRKNQEFQKNRNEKSEKGGKTMQNPLEAVVLQSWIEISGMDEFSTTDSFLGHGGNSLHFVQLASRLQKIFGIEITTESVFRHGTVEQLARFIETSRDQAATASSQAHG